MAHYAELDDNNIVKRVVVINNEDCLDENNVESELIGALFCNKLYGGNWKKTSYNGNIRKNYAGTGYKYDQERDAFIPPKLFVNWILNEETCQWESPIEYPDDDKRYLWNDNKGEWEELIPVE